MKFIINPLTGDLFPYTNPVVSDIIKQQNRSVNFDHNTFSPYLLRTTLGTSRILEIIVGIDVAFNGSGWSLSVGDSNNYQSLVAPNQVALDRAEKFELTPGIFYSQPTQIFLYLSAGSATTGSGFIYLLEG